MRVFILILATITILCRAAFGAVWYVDKDNVSGTEDGTSWATAFTSVQEGIDAGFDDDGGEIWVAEGVYNEERENDTGSVLMLADVHLYGGFVGSETALNQRDWTASVTVIDGSTARGGEQAYHVAVGAADATLDGFTITGGNGDGDFDPEDARLRVGGMYNYYTHPVTPPIVRNCTFADNRANYGGGMFNESSAVIVTDCVFTGNTASLAGGGI